ncbi:hypothetical protein BDW68DRAFT_133150 [Aspergillus falconensis]
MIRTATIGPAAQWLCRNRDRHFHRIISQVPALEANCRNSTRLFHPIYGVDFLHLLCYLLLLPLTCAFVLCLLTLSLEEQKKLTKIGAFPSGHLALSLPTTRIRHFNPCFLIT